MGGTSCLMTQKEQIEKTIAFVKETLVDAEGGHDWFHTLRVYNNSLLISKKEDVASLIGSLGPLLHDTADSKSTNGDETLAPKLAREFLTSLQVAKNVLDHVILIIENISY